MRNYTWPYGIFHWIVHYTLTIALIGLSGVSIFPAFASITMFGSEMQISIADYFLAFVLTFLIDLDHWAVLRKFGIKKMIFAQKRLISPLHNFLSLSFFSIAAALTAIFYSKAVGVIIFVVVLHMLWDIFEDVLIFRTSFRRWENTWGLNKKDIEDMYNELLKQPPQEKKESRIRKAVARIKNKISRKKEIKLSESY